MIDEVPVHKRWRFVWAAHELDEDIVPPAILADHVERLVEVATKWTTQRRASSRTTRSLDVSWSSRRDCSMAETTQPRAQSRRHRSWSHPAECSRSAMGRLFGRLGRTSSAQVEISASVIPGPRRSVT